MPRTDDFDDVDTTIERKAKAKHSHRDKDDVKDKHRQRTKEKASKDAAEEKGDVAAANGVSSAAAEDSTQAPGLKRDDHRDSHRSSRREHDGKKPDKDRRRDRDKEKDRDRDRDRHSKQAKAEGRDDRERHRGDKDVPRKEPAEGKAGKEEQPQQDREMPPPPALPTDEAVQQELPGPPPAAPPAPQASEQAPVIGQVRDSGGEISMSIEETNRVRISLGLKPLSTENEADKRRKEAQEREAKRAEEAKQTKAAELAERVRSQREKRVEDERMRATKTLGQAEPEVDDLGAWVRRSRALEEKAKAEAREKALRQARALQQQDDDFEASDDEDEPGRPVANAKELAGMKVRHDAEELNEGETMILTLADRNILDERGDLDEDAPDELENALVVEERKRAKARKAAAKQADAEVGEDGRPRGMLAKYDEEAGEAGMRIDEAGLASNAEHAARQAEIRAKLAAAEDVAGALQQAGYDTRSEYYTQDEMSQLFKPKAKKKKKKLRKKDAAEDLSFLEEEAAAAAAGADHGSRADRSAIADTQSADRDKAAALKQQRYESALEKANYASLALKEDASAGLGDEEDEELYDTLARARRAAQAKTTQAEAEKRLTLDRVVEEARRRREAEEARAAREAAQGGEMAFTEAAEFARSIQIEAPEEDAAAADVAAGAASVRPKVEELSHMGVDDEEPAQTPLPAPRPDAAPGTAAWGNWVSAEDPAGAGGAAQLQDVEMADVKDEDEGEEEKGGAAAAPPEELVTREKAIGKGLAGCLALLKERGGLTEQVEWAGRTTDIVAAQRLVQEGQLRDVYTGGRQESAVAANIERALTQRDEFGRIMTPKERFRVLNYGFHGIDPSRNKKDRKFRKVAEEQERKRRAMSDAGDDSSFARIQAVQRATAAPYLVLSGNVRPGQSSDPASGYATVEREPVALTPVLGGGQTPLTGVRKVEAMLGLKRPPPAAGSSSSMAPPPPGRPKNT